MEMRAEDEDGEVIGREESMNLEEVERGRSSTMCSSSFADAEETMECSVGEGSGNAHNCTYGGRKCQREEQEGEEDEEAKDGEEKEEREDANHDHYLNLQEKEESRRRRDSPSDNNLVNAQEDANNYIIEKEQLVQGQGEDYQIIEIGTYHETPNHYQRFNHQRLEEEEQVEILNSIYYQRHLPDANHYHSDANLFNHQNLNNFNQSYSSFAPSSASDANSHQQTEVERAVATIPIPLDANHFLASPATPNFLETPTSSVFNQETLAQPIRSSVIQEPQKRRGSSSPVSGRLIKQPVGRPRRYISTLASHISFADISNEHIIHQTRDANQQTRGKRGRKRGSTAASKYSRLASQLNQNNNNLIETDAGQSNHSASSSTVVPKEPLSPGSTIAETIMKEKSKTAARSRREKENTEFNELGTLLPLPSAITSQLDKASIIRLTTSYLRLRDIFPDGLGDDWGSRPIQRDNTYCNGGSIEIASSILQTLDGFVFVVARDGKIMYISETASTHLGLSQVELTGNSIHEYIYNVDHEEIHKVLNDIGSKPIVNDVGDVIEPGTGLYSEYESSLTRNQINVLLASEKRHNHNSYQLNNYDHNLLPEEVTIIKSFPIRMKCVLAKRNAGLTTTLEEKHKPPKPNSTGTFKVIHCCGYLKLRRLSGLDNVSVVNDNVSTTIMSPNGSTSSLNGATNGTYNKDGIVDCGPYGQYKITGFVSIATSFPSSAITEVKMFNSMFMTRCSLGLVILFMDQSASRSSSFNGSESSLSLLGYEANELQYQTMYQLVHAADQEHIRECHVNILHKDQAISKYYRFLCKDGGYVWMQSYSTKVHSPNRSSANRKDCIVTLHYILSGVQYGDVQFNLLQPPKEQQHHHHLRSISSNHINHDEGIDVWNECDTDNHHRDDSNNGSCNAFSTSNHSNISEGRTSFHGVVGTMVEPQTSLYNGHHHQHHNNILITVAAEEDDQNEGSTSNNVIVQNKRRKSIEVIKEPIPAAPKKRGRRPKRLVDSCPNSPNDDVKECLRNGLQQPLQQLPFLVVGHEASSAVETPNWYLPQTVDSEPTKDTKQKRGRKRRTEKRFNSWSGNEVPLNDRAFNNIGHHDDHVSEQNSHVEIPYVDVHGYNNMDHIMVNTSNTSVINYGHPNHPLIHFNQQHYHQEPIIQEPVDDVDNYNHHHDVGHIYHENDVVDNVSMVMMPATSSFNVHAANHSHYPMQYNHFNHPTFQLINHHHYHHPYHSQVQYVEHNGHDETHLEQAIVPISAPSSIHIEEVERQEEHVDGGHNEKSPGMMTTATMESNEVNGSGNNEDVVVERHDLCNL